MLKKQRKNRDYPKKRKRKNKPTNNTFRKCCQRAQAKQDLVKQYWQTQHISTQQSVQQ